MRALRPQEKIVCVKLSVTMTLLALLSRSIFFHQNSSNLCIVSHILNRSGIASNFNNFQFQQLQPCLIGGIYDNNNINKNQLSSSLIMDYLSSGTFYGRSYMRNWNRRLKQHGLRVTLSKRTKYAGNRVMMWVKVRRRSLLHPRGIQKPRKRHNDQKHKR